MTLRNFRRFVSDETGAVMMEYVIVGLLVAVACLLGIVVFSRAIFGGFDTAQLGATGDSKNSKGAQEHYRKQVGTDSETAKKYHDSMHTGNITKNE